MTMDELYRLLREADNMMHATQEEMLFDAEAEKVLGYWPEWHNMRMQ